MSRIPDYAQRGSRLASLDHDNLIDFSHADFPPQSSHASSASSLNPFDPPTNNLDDDLIHSDPYKPSYGVVRDRGPSNSHLKQPSMGRNGDNALSPFNTNTDSHYNYDNNYDDDDNIVADLGYDENPFFDGSMPGLASDNNNLSPSSGGLSNMYNNMKRTLGMKSRKSRYTEMDYPLTELSHDNELPVHAGGERQSEFDAQRDDRLLHTQDEKQDFDIRRIWHKIIRKKDSAHLNQAEDGDPNAGPRIVYLNNPPANKVIGYGDNHISTTKYNVATFIPKFLFEQFSKYANLFFLCTALIQQVPNVSPTNRYTTIGTLAVVLSVSAVKELSEDFKRRNADNELNSSKSEVLNPSTGEWITKKWIHVAVGDIVRVKSEHPFPSDLVLLASSEPEGLCYIETANLDGETNLKIKQAHMDTAHLVDPGDLARVTGKLESERPNSSLYTYEATLNLDVSHGHPKLVPLSPEQLLLRGATLRNTAWVHGLVVFTGHETKLMRNATATPIKRTAVEHMLNLQIIFLFSILIILAIVASLGNVVKIKIAGEELSYLYLEGTNLVSLFFLDILTYWILFSNLVPISLFVTVEVIKFYQAYLISSDLDMYYAPTDTPTVCRTSSLVEELGQIEYIFSDKTGTLTCNVMEFRSCTIAGRQYTGEVPEDGKATMVDGVEVGFHDFDTLRKHMVNSEAAEVIQEFFTLLAACHTVIPEIDEYDGSIKYQAASPDEGALVDGAAQLGYKFLIRRPRSITIEIRGTQYEYELLNICEFNSTRKRMSAIFRCPDGQIRLYCKGADTVILERLSESNNPFVEDTLRHLEDFASEGLRTLCLATRVIPDNEYASWIVHFNKASTSLGNRSQALDDAAEMIERDLYLLGATAIEDKLQDGVPETIRVLQEAGIKIWVLTGDRQETAVNIGMSCKLLSEDMSLLMVNELDSEATRYNIQKKLAAIRGQVAGAAELDTLALVIDGKSLGYALEPELERDFLDLAVMCKAVICCRVSPLQKALVVKLVKRHLKALLLAIGDGANDVSMIQAAHVGVGISGMEGMQAARSADVAIGQFKYLRKLLLVHGAWSYHRLSKAILYSFYKNIALYMTQFWYVFQNGFSGQSIYESWTITFYNVFFTVLPPFVIGVFDQYLSARLLDRYPQLYQLGQKGRFFNTKHFWQWIINGFYHSIILYYGSAAAYRYGTQLSDGLAADHWVWGTALYTACVITALGKAALITNLWTKFTILAIPGSLLLWFAFFPAYAVIAPLINVSTEYRGVLPHLYPCLTFWVMIWILPVMCLLRDFSWKYYKRMYYPESYHHVQEIQKYNIADYRPRMEQFQKAIRKVRQVQRMRKQRGFAFSQADEGQERIIRAYDTTQTRGKYGEMKSGNDQKSTNQNDLDVFF